MFAFRVGAMVLALVALAAQARAQGGPPMLTDDPGTPGMGRWEINLGITTEDRANRRVFELPFLDANYGVGKRIQVKFEMPWLAVNQLGEPTRAGLGNSLLGVKWRFRDEDRHQVAVSIYPQFEFNNPTNSAKRGLVERGSSLFLPFQAQKDLGPVSANGEFGYLFRTNGGDEWIYGLAIGRQISAQFELIAEIHGTAGREPEPEELVLNFGSRVKLNSFLTFLLSAGRGLGDLASGGPQFLAYFAIQFNFN